MSNFWFGFTVGCLAVIVTEIIAATLYVFKRGGKK